MSKQTPDRWSVLFPVSGIRGVAILLAALIVLALSACVTAAPPEPDSFLADLEPIAIGELDAGIVKPFSQKLDRITLTASFHPRTNTVEFQFPHQLNRYHQFWSTSNRQAFLQALARYEADFEAKNLPAGSSSKTGRAYASFEARAEWGFPTKFILNYEGHPRIDLGYAFHNNSPYFTITQRAAPNTRTEKASGGVNVSSLQVVFYFTRAMARDIAAFFDQDTLILNIPPQYRPAPGTVPPIQSEAPLSPSAIPADAY